MWACVCVNGYLVITGEAISNCSPCLANGWVPTLSPWAWYCPTCRVLAFLQMDLPALALSTWVLPRHPSAPLGRCDHLVAAKDFAFTFFACVHAHDYVFYKTVLELALVGPILLVYRCKANMINRKEQHFPYSIRSKNRAMHHHLNTLALSTLNSIHNEDLHHMITEKPCTVLKIILTDFF